MAVIGCLGDIIFSVSSDVVKTLDNMQWSGKARYGTHQRHLRDALTEFVGLDPDGISFDIQLNRNSGILQTIKRSLLILISMATS